MTAPADCGHPNRSGRDRPCGTCRRQQVVTTVIAAEPSLPAGQVIAVFDATVTSGPAVGALARALAADPHVLHTGAPPVVSRLVDALVAAGSTTFRRPACEVCGRTGRPLNSIGTMAMCSRCAHRASATACSRCGQHRPVAARTGHGQPMCERCRRHTRGQRRCGICGDIAPIAVRARQGRPDICASCYRLPEAVCSGCGRTRPCSFADTDTPTCKACAPRATATCSRCGHDRPPTARQPDGPICEPCYRDTAVRRCSTCGSLERLFERGCCVRCVLTRRATELLADADGHVDACFADLLDAIVVAPQPYSAVNWLRTGTSAAILREIATGKLALTHDALDGHPRPRAADHLRRILVAHGLLENRDQDIVRTQLWVQTLLADIDDADDRRLLGAYASWRVLRRLRRRAATSRGPWTATRTARNQLAAATDLLEWLHQRDTTIAQAGQGDIDAWLTTGPAAAAVRDFLAWTADHGHSQRLAVSPPAVHTGTAMDSEDRWDILARLLHDDALELTDRVAGSLLLCYAQPLSRITAITRDQITCHSQHATIRFGASDIVVPEPLAALLAAHLDTPPTYVGVGAPTTSPWLFPGQHAGRPLTPARLGARLNKLGIDARAARRAALLQLAAELPAAVLADLLNLTPGTAVGWVNNAGGDWSRYAAALVNDTITTPAEPVT